MELGIYSWNINGLRAILKKGDLVNFIKEYKPDILAIQETKLDNENIKKNKSVKEFVNFLEENGYDWFHSEAKIKKGYSGVMTIVKKDLNPKFKEGLGIKKIDQEGRIIKTFFDNEKMKNLIFYNVYFPNGKASEDRLKYKLWFYEEFLKHIKEEKKKYKQIVAGDVNTAHKEIDLARPKDNENVSGFLPIEREWISKLLNSGYIDTFRYLFKDLIKYSWWSMRTKARERNIGWRIDYIFISDDLLKNLKDAFIMNEIYGSDHCPVGIKIKL